MKSMSRISRIYLLLILACIVLNTSCRKCQRCISQCVQYYIYDPSNPYAIATYDTICSDSFSNWQIFVGKVNSSGYAGITILSSDTFSSCGSPVDRVQRARCY